nr:MAG TPA: hypothetical protein [Caudoviricetes sp.]
MIYMKIAICDDDNLRIEIFKNSIDRYLKEHGDGDDLHENCDL